MREKARCRSKTISLSEEMFFKVSQEENASGLIDSLLYKHFKEKEIEAMNRPELEKRAEILEKKIELEQLENGQ